MLDKIYEHLKTKRKYNTLNLKYEVLQDEYDKKVVELNTEKRIRIIEKNKFEDEIQKLTEEIVKLKGGKKNGVKISNTKTKRDRSKNKSNS